MSTRMLLGQLLIGLINGSFYALLSLGLAIIFGLLNIVNFSHGALYTLGAFAAWLLATYLGVDYWAALVVAPLAVGCLGFALERLIIRRTYKLDHLYALLLTLGLGSTIEGLLVVRFGAVGKPYGIPGALRGMVNLGFMALPLYRGWVIVASVAICGAVWGMIERTKLGSYLRAATENAALVQAFGINVPRMISLTFAGGAALAALAGVLAAPIYQVSALMGTNLIIVVFAVVVIGGMGSIAGSIVTGFGLGVVEAMAKLFWPEAANLVVFIVMALVLLTRPAGLFGRAAQTATDFATGEVARPTPVGHARDYRLAIAAMAVVLLGAPFLAYPVFLMDALCFALFAISVNFLLGFVGLGSFGHAMFLGTAGYVTGFVAKSWGWPPEAALLAGTFCSALLGLAVGVLAIRRQKIYFAMITLALGELVYFVFLQAPFTHGEDGLQSVPRGILFGVIDLDSDLTMYFVVLAIFMGGFLIVFRAIHSPFGHVLRAIRENEARAISLGYHTDRLKLLAFVLSAGVAGLAGATKVIVTQIASLADVHHSTSGDVILMTLVGGVGTIFGPVAGAFVVTGMQHYLAPLGAWVTAVQGIVFVVCVLSFRQGLMGQLAKSTGRYF